MTVSEQPKAARASSKIMFRSYQVGLSIAVLALLGYESILGRAVAIVLLILVLVPIIAWFMLQRARAGQATDSSGR
jgi:hypothetical protein